MPELMIADELERKTLAYLEDAALRHQQGVYSDREFKLVMEAVWQCTAGLVDGVQPIAADVADMNLSGVVKTLAVPLSAEKAVINIERDGCVVRIKTAHNPAGTPHEYETEAEAIVAINKLKTTLEGRGFIIA
jgi:hypothetical protein